MITTLKSFLQRLIKKYEGGYVNRASDPGGPTNFGITWRALAAHRGEPATSAAEWAPKVKAMSIDEAVKIYEKNFAPPIHYNDLPLGVDVVMMDYGVNSGPGRPVRVACSIVGSPGTKLTPEVLEKIKAFPANVFINKMCDERLAFMKSLKGGAMWQEYGKGWGARVADLRSYSVSLAHGGTVAPAPDLSNVPTPKAEVPKPSQTGTATGSGLGGVFASVAGYLADIPVGWIIGGVVAVLVLGVAIGVYRDLKAQHAEAKVHI